MITWNRLGYFAYVSSCRNWTIEGRLGETRYNLIRHGRRVGSPHNTVQEAKDAAERLAALTPAR